MYCTSGKFCTKPACDDDNDDESCSFRLVATLFQKLYVHCSESYDGEEQSVHVVSEFRPALQKPAGVFSSDGNRDHLRELCKFPGTFICKVSC